MQQKKNADQNNGANFRETETKKGSKNVQEQLPFLVTPKVLYKMFSNTL